MNHQENQAIIINTIAEYQLTGDTQVKDVISNSDILGIAVHLSYKLPLNPDMLIRYIDTLILDINSKGITFGIVSEKINILLRLYLKGELKKEQRILLIFYLMYSFAVIEKGSITKELNYLIPYFRAYLIPNAEQLTKEIELNPVIGTTGTIGEYFVRLANDFSLIPTQEVALKFSNYLT